VTTLRRSHVPQGCVRPIAVGVPALEIAFAVALLISPAFWLPLIMLGTAALFGIFTAWLGWVYARKLQVSCGCFGSSTQPVNLRTIGRNVVLLGVAGCGTMLAVNTGSLLPQLVEWQAGVLALLSASGMILIVTQQNAIHIATSSSFYHTETMSPRRRFIQRLLIGAVTTIATTAGVKSVFAAPPCSDSDCRCNEAQDQYNTCAGCAAKCASSCPPPVCNGSIYSVTTKQCCTVNPGQNCFTRVRLVATVDCCRL
jgi:hypothetical protein